MSEPHPNTTVFISAATLEAYWQANGKEGAELSDEQLELIQGGRPDASITPVAYSTAKGLGLNYSLEAGGEEITPPGPSRTAAELNDGRGPENPGTSRDQDQQYLR